MRNLFIAFALVAFVGSANIAAAAPQAEIVKVFCDNCKDHKCKKACKKNGKCTAEAKACCAKKADKGSSTTSASAGGDGAAAGGKTTGKTGCSKAAAKSCHGHGKTKAKAEEKPAL